MNDRFIESCHIPLYYEKKPDTKGSYYQYNGKRNILPKRISLGIFAQRKTSQKDFHKKNEINAQYKKNEEGLYYSLNYRKVHSSIWYNEDFPEFYGYGIIDERFSIYDLIILYSGNNCISSFEIHLFRGLGKLEYQKQAFQYLREHINKKPH
jgi:hypothetical protein